MPESRPDPDDLVMTQAQLPPGIDAPSSKGVLDELAAERRKTGTTQIGAPAPSESGEPGGISFDLVREIHALADRVGGLDRLRGLIDELVALNR